METIYHFFAAFDIFHLFIQIFPAIVNPIADAFLSIFHQVFSSFKGLFIHHPSIIFGILILLGFYGSHTFFYPRRKKRLSAIKK